MCKKSHRSPTVGIGHPTRTLHPDSIILNQWANEPCKTSIQHYWIREPELKRQCPREPRAAFFDSTIYSISTLKNKSALRAISSSKSLPSTYYASTKANAHAHDLLNLAKCRDKHESTYSVSTTINRRSIKMPLCKWSLIWTMLRIIHDNSRAVCQGQVAEDTLHNLSSFVLGHLQQPQEKAREVADLAMT